MRFEIFIALALIVIVFVSVRTLYLILKENPVDRAYRTLRAAVTPEARKLALAQLRTLQATEAEQLLSNLRSASGFDPNESKKARKEAEDLLARYRPPVKENVTDLATQLWNKVEALKRPYRPTPESVRTHRPIAVIEWVNNHREEVARYRGSRIAVHPQRGIIASGSSYSDVCKILKSMGIQSGVAIISV